jgi:hypothetical protein
MDETKKFEQLSKETGIPVDYIKREWKKYAAAGCGFNTFASIFRFIAGRLFSVEV